MSTVTATAHSPPPDTTPLGGLPSETALDSRATDLTSHSNTFSQIYDHRPSPSPRQLLSPPSSLISPPSDDSPPPPGSPMPDNAPEKSHSASSSVRGAGSARSGSPARPSRRPFGRTSSYHQQQHQQQQQPSPLQPPQQQSWYPPVTTEAFAQSPTHAAQHPSFGHYPYPSIHAQQHTHARPPYVVGQEPYTISLSPTSGSHGGQPHFPFTNTYGHPGLHARVPVSASPQVLGLSSVGMQYGPIPAPHGLPFPFHHGHQQQSAPPDQQSPTLLRTHSFPGQPSAGTSTAVVTAVPGNYHSIDGHNQSSHPSPSHQAQPLHFPSSSTPTHYAYPPHSFPHSSPTLYAPPYGPSHYGSYGMHQAHPQHRPHHPSDESSPSGQQSGGTWWYLPPTTPSYEAQYQGPFVMSYGQPGVDPATYSGSATLPPQASTSSAQYPDATLSPAAPPTITSQPGRSPADSDSPPPILLQPLSPHTPASPVSPTRRPYHSNPPAQRSEWVMWVGSVPPDATHDELWRFFNQPEPGATSGPGSSTSGASSGQAPPGAHTSTADSSGGVTSVFLIARSKCAFVNFDSEAHLERAVARFNGQPLRGKESRWPNLVCRIRRRDDDLRAGVGAQRGMKIHMQWVTDQMKKAGADKSRKGETPGPEDPPTSPSTYLAPSSCSDPSPPILARSPPFDDDRRRADSGDWKARTGNSGSSASTTSSFLTRYFPRRYFILKSLTQGDLDISLETGLWATQVHNEGVLDRAFRTSKDVFLIFGVNKSGEFFGYARMSGPISGERRVSWVSRVDSGRSASSPNAPRESQHTPGVVVDSAESKDSSSPLPESTQSSQSNLLFSPAENRLADSSPGPVTPGESRQLAAKQQPEQRADTGGNTPQRPPTPKRELQSAPAVLGRAHSKHTIPSRGGVSDTGPAPPSRTFALDAGAPLRAVREQGEETATAEPGGSPPHHDRVLSVDSGDLATQKKEGPEGEESWGTPFKIQWIHTERLPFHRTRHLRNPWNHNREVKVSRDGTEIEPTVGQALLDEWERLDPDKSPAPPARPAAAHGSRGGGRSATAIASVI